MPQNIVIILDIRKDISDSNPCERSFFDRGKECVTRIIERKIMSVEEVFIGIILLGSNRSTDPEILYELEKPSWKMIRNLPEMPSQNKGNWLAALTIANSLLAKKALKSKTFENRIILISNLIESTNIEMTKLEETLVASKNENIRIDVIGCDRHLARKIAESTNGLSTSFDDAMKEFIFYRKKHVNGHPWEIELTLGEIKIPVSIHKRNIDESILKKWNPVKDSTSNKSKKENVQKKTSYINSENKNMNAKDLIQGYMYGSKVIPTSELDKNLIYMSGPESLVLYGFTSSSNVNWENLNDNTLSYVLWQKGNRNARKTIKYIAQCLHELNLVGIAKGVKVKDKSPRMYALMPVFDTNDFVCLSMASVCYKQEIRYMAFPQTSKKINCTTEQVEAFKDLIGAMDLTNINDEGFGNNEAYITGETPSPSAQHSIECVAYRVKNPKTHLPRPNNDVLSLLEVPPVIQNRAKDSLDKLRSLFVLNVKNVCIDESTLDNNAEPMELASCSNMQDDIEKQIYSIGTIDPINDYKKCLLSGKSLNNLAREMVDAIESLMYSNLNEHLTKALDAMRYLRLECVKGDPSYYNNWLKNFKLELADHGRNDVIDLINENEMDLLLKTENILSDINFKEYPTQPMETETNFTQLKVSSKIEDLFE